MGWLAQRFSVDRKLNIILANQGVIMSALSDLVDEVAKVEASVSAAVVLLGTIADDSVALADLKTRLTASQVALDAAVAAHTPA